MWHSVPKKSVEEKVEIINLLCLLLYCLISPKMSFKQIDNCDLQVSAFCAKLGLGSLGTNALFATWRTKGHSVLVVKLVPTVRCVIIAPIKKWTLSIHPTFPKKITFKFFDYRMLYIFFISLLWRNRGKKMSRSSEVGDFYTLNHRSALGWLIMTPPQFRGLNLAALCNFAFFICN